MLECEKDFICNQCKHVFSVEVTILSCVNLITVTVISRLIAAAIITKLIGTIGKVLKKGLKRPFQWSLNHPSIICIDRVIVFQSLRNFEKLGGGFYLRCGY